MTGFLAGLPAFWAFAVIWVGAFTVFVSCSLLRLGYLLRRDRRAVGRFFETGAAMPVLAAYRLAGEREATRTGILVLARRHRRPPGRRRVRREARPEPDPLLAALRAAVRDAGGSGPVEDVMASSRFPAFSSRLRKAARRNLPRRRMRYEPDHVAAWAAVLGFFAVFVYGIGVYVRQPDSSGLWFLIALVVHAPVAAWIGMADRRSGRHQWPEFDALCERCVAQEQARAPRPKQAADVRPTGTTSVPESGQGRTSSWANDGGVGATSSCGGGGCGGGI
ncbi:hypothetical protein [Streptomyces atroolivaceus]|uniref:hypothetical protein n=1 Tax=Streptomyces atroolivaceus TaxID=66869 RepID=UPI0036263397